MLPDIITKLIRAGNGDILAIASLADEVAGGHVKKFFESTQQKLDAATAEDTRDALLEMMKQVGYNATAFQVALEVLQLLQDDVEAVKKIAAKWEVSKESQPDLRDVVVGATTIAPTFAASTGPVRKMYIEALRGSYTPEIFAWSFGQELLESMIGAKLLPGDIGVLSELTTKSSTRIDVFVDSTSDFDPYERLAKGGFVDLRQKGMSAGSPLFITARVQATTPAIDVTVTKKGHRLLTMLKAGRGE